MKTYQDLYSTPVQSSNYKETFDRGKSRLSVPEIFDSRERKVGIRKHTHLNVSIFYDQIITEFMTVYRNLTPLSFLSEFSSEERCVKFFEKVRWGDNVVCPHCNHDKVYRTNCGFKCASPLCYKKFTVKVGTVFEGSNIKLQKWSYAIYLFSSSKTKITASVLAKELKVSQKTAWFIFHRIREIYQEKAPKLISE